ncbi:TPA: hypothetical protein DCX15_05500 [bacterium]|nr:hypothetical protein [bacterium]
MNNELSPVEELLIKLYIQHGDSIYFQYAEVIESKFPELKEYLNRMRIIRIIESNKQISIDDKPYYPYKEEEEDLDLRAFEAIPYIVRSINYITPHLNGRKEKILNIGTRKGLEVSIMKEMGYMNAVDVGINDGQVDTSSFKDESINLIYCRRGLEHLKNPKKVIDEFFRILKPGGLLFIIVPIIGAFKSADSLKRLINGDRILDYSIKMGHNLLPEIWMIGEEKEEMKRREVVYSPDIGLTVSAYRYSFIEYLKEESKLCEGKVLDVGAGGWVLPWRLFRHCEYITMDVEKNENIDVVGDVQDMHMFEDSSFDVIICSEVLEHVPSPHRAISEIYRILKPGGKLLLTVPFDIGLHDCPGDYWRFTEQGLKILLEEFSEVEIKFKGIDSKPLGYTCTCRK